MLWGCPILDKIKGKDNLPSPPPPPPQSNDAGAKEQKRPAGHFSIIEKGGRGGPDFSFILSKIESWTK